MTEPGRGLRSGVKPAATDRSASPSFGSMSAGCLGIGWLLVALVFAAGYLFLPFENGALKAGVIALTVASGLFAFTPVVSALRKAVPPLRPTPVPPSVAAALFIAAALIAGPQLAADPSNRTGGEGAGGSTTTEALAGAERPPRTEPAAVEEDATKEAEVRAMWAEVERITAPCDAATDGVLRSLESGSGVSLPALYSETERGQRICGQAGVDVKRVRAPRSLSRAERRQFDQALDMCGNAYLAKAIMLGDMRSVIDGDRRPSQLARLQQAGAQSQAQVFACVLRMTELAQAQGIDLTPESAGS